MGVATGGAEAATYGSDGRQPGMAQAVVSQLRCGQQSHGALSESSTTAGPWQGISACASDDADAAAVARSETLAFAPAPTAMPETTRHRARTTRRDQRVREHNGMVSSVAEVAEHILRDIDRCGVVLASGAHPFRRQHGEDLSTGSGGDPVLADDDIYYFIGAGGAGLSA